MLFRSRVLGPDHPGTLASRNNLALAYESAGRLDETIGLYEQNLADCERFLNSDHPCIEAFRDNLADAYRAVGRDKALIFRREGFSPFFSLLILAFSLLIPPKLVTLLLQRPTERSPTNPNGFHSFGL